MSIRLYRRGMLAVLATMIGRKRQVEIKPGWIEFAILWIAIVARSGDRKSPALNLVTEPIRIKQRLLAAEYTDARERYEELAPEEQKTQTRPKLQQVSASDCTMEALKDVIPPSPFGLLYFRDELVGWARSQGQYKSGKGDDRQHWLSIWSGEQLISNRVGKEPVLISDPNVCVTGGLQPDVLGELAYSSLPSDWSIEIARELNRGRLPDGLSVLRNCLTKTKIYPSRPLHASKLLLLPRRWIELS